MLLNIKEIIKSFPFKTYQTGFEGRSLKGRCLRGDLITKYLRKLVLSAFHTKLHNSLEICKKKVV